MRSARVIPINSDPHFEDYAEMPYFESWDEKVTRHLRKDEEAAAMLYIVVSVGIAFLLIYVVPAAWRILR